MTIVLPHGVLFRGGEEYEIRKNLIEKNNIDTIIGLPSNIFFGTWIPTIIMVLKKRKPDTNIQIIDASKFYIKDGKNNKLRACDIKRIVDIIMARKDKEKFSRIVSRDEIVENDYNLNIPRYVDSSETPEQRDIYATKTIKNTSLLRLKISPKNSKTILPSSPTKKTLKKPLLLLGKSWKLSSSTHIKKSTSMRWNPSSEISFLTFWIRLSW